MAETDVDLDELDRLYSEQRDREIGFCWPRIRDEVRRLRAENAELRDALARGREGS